MNLRDILLDKKSAVVDKWFDTIMESYPSDVSGFIKTHKDPFANPVGRTFFHGIEGILDDILKGGDGKESSPLLEDIVKVRAVQDFTPSRALSFIFLLKNVIRELLGREICEDRAISADLADLEARIDGTALLAFDIYVKCKEKIYDIKANELKRSMFRLLQQANLLTETAESDSQESNLMDKKRKEAAQ